MQTPPADRPKLLAHLPAFLPERRAGSEISMAATLRAFKESGWQVRVIVDSAGAPGEVEGLEVIRCPGQRELLDLYRTSDVVVTQLESRNRAMRWSTLTKRPLVLFLRMGGVDPQNLLVAPDLIVFNANWLRESSKWRGPAAVQRPPIDVDRYRTEPGHAVTLVNLSERKGGPILLELAERCPDVEFLGVQGGWGAQLQQPTPKNLSIIGPVNDMREVYSQTRVLLMPSSEEPFGRVGVEAACSGIPTVATPLPGIREALGDAAVYVPRNDLDGWERRVRELVEDELLWRQRSEMALHQARHWASLDERAEIVEAISDLRGRQR